MPTAFDAHGNATTRVPLGEQRAQVVEVEAALVVDLAETDRQTLVVRELEPRRDVAVMVELGADDLVAVAPVAGGGAREREVERRHVRAERDLVDRRVQELRCGLVRVRDELVR